MEADDNHAKTRPGKAAVVRVGPAGWSYEDWKGIVYPEPMPKTLHPLTLLSGLFDALEVNSTFYRPPLSKNCASWLQKAARNPHFAFTVKLWQRFTHERDVPFSREEVQTYCDGIVPLVREGKLGAVLVQFPWSFRRTPENRIWLARVIDAFHAYPLALEIRHASWDQPEVYAALAERGVAFCNIDQPLFTGSLQPTEHATARTGYVRLHGRNHDDWFRDTATRDERYDYLYSEDELKPWIEKIESLRRVVDEIYVITNNHYRGQAVVNALELQYALGKRDTVIPQHLIDQYPRLRRPAQ